MSCQVSEMCRGFVGPTEAESWQSCGMFYELGGGCDGDVFMSGNVPPVSGQQRVFTKPTQIYISQRITQFLQGDKVI